MNIKPKHSGLIYGEGSTDKNFIVKLFELSKFKFHTKKWSFQYGNAKGSSVETVLLKCTKAALGRSYDLILCFVDIDRLKQDYKRNWEKKQRELEKKYPNIIIIWQYDKAEDEYKRVLGESSNSKHRLNKLAKEKIKKFINSDFWRRIMEPIRNKENELEN